MKLSHTCFFGLGTLMTQAEAQSQWAVTKIANGF